MSLELANPLGKEVSTHFTVPVQGPSCEFSPCLALSDGLELANTGSLSWILSPQVFHFYLSIFAGKKRDMREWNVPYIDSTHLQNRTAAIW